MISKSKVKLIVASLILAFANFSTTLKAQTLAVKTNALYLATTTPNLGAEVSLGKKHTAQLFFGLNPWKWSDGKSTRHWCLMPEYRHWFCQSFNGWFVGAHLMGGEFNVANLDLPFGLVNELEDHRYEGWYAGGGVTAGYQWPVSKHWNIEASMGVGYDYIQYDKFKCGECGEKLKSSHTNYIGPTKFCLSVLYLF